MSVRDYGIAAPHGPNVHTEEHIATQDIPNQPNMSEKEAGVLNQFIYPDDIYTEDGVYWADLPLAKKVAFVHKVDRQEVKKEIASIGQMIKRDPLSPVGYYFKNMVIPGAGLLLEGYVLFSIGNIKPLFQAVFPSCWGKPPKGHHAICDPKWIAAVDYMEIVGIIVGQIAVGIIGDWIGRRWGLIQDAGIMVLGLIMLTASWGVTQNGWVICYVWSLWFYSVGVGGEYPMTATSGMENAVGSGKVSTREDRLHRGRNVTGAFLMQGWGQLLNQALLCVLLLMFHHGSGKPPYSEVAAQWTFRVSFAIPALGTLWLVYYRTYRMKSASKQLIAAKKKSKVTGYDTKSLKLTFTHFGTRLLATAGTWYCNDVFFYGNKLFQGQFIAVLTPGNKSVMTGWLYNLLNVGVSLLGYYLASFLIDNKLYGRKWMQMVGFFADFIFFIIPAFSYSYYTSEKGIHAFQAMYFLSSFFNQFGPNCVTFLISAEVYPTPIRATAHGISAAAGKLGALTAAILYNYIDTKMRFLVVPWFGLAGALLTLLFLPDTTGLDLKEQERRWRCIREEREEDYHGIAIHPQHLSLWERMRGAGKHYNPALDYQQKVDEFRGEWLAREQAKAVEQDNNRDPDAAGFEDTGEWSDELDSYFTRTAGNSPQIEGKVGQVPSRIAIDRIDEKKEE